MNASRFNILTEPLIAACPHGKLTLPGVLAALARDEVVAWLGPTIQRYLTESAAPGA